MSVSISIYSYEELFELIKIQADKEKKDVKPPSKMQNFLSEAVRTINNPTSQNLNRTIGIITTQEKKEDNPDNRLNYIYRAS